MMASPHSAGGPLLVFDAASPTVSAALASDGELLGSATVPVDRDHPSDALLALIARLLTEAGLAPRELAGLVTLQGPGSFTGLRVGLATALGLHAALGLPATAISTFDALALQVGAEELPALAVVDAWRDEWFVVHLSGEQSPAFSSPPQIVPTAELARLDSRLVFGFGVGRLRAVLPGSVLVREPLPLAAPVARELSLHSPDWDAHRLVAPLYLRSPTPLLRLAAAGG